jgi:dTDP-4-dehydrorhamnose reductase
MKIAVLGSTGQLGSDAVRVLLSRGHEVVALSHEAVEVTDREAVRAALHPIQADVVVNCAAFVRVDDAEDRALEVFKTNAIGALNVARTCSDQKAVCVFISTDFVFDGEKDTAYTETDVPHPINVYGASKLAGEYLVRASCQDWIIVRVASLFGKSGARGKGGNFVETVLRKAEAREGLRVVTDIQMSPTYTVDAATALEGLITSGARGLFHVTNHGSCSWFEFARKVIELSGIEARVDPISSAEYPTKARRPVNSALRSDRLERVVREPPRKWGLALEAYLKERADKDR